jgi:hypothetical protein
VLVLPTSEWDVYKDQGIRLRPSLLRFDCRYNPGMEHHVYFWLKEEFKGEEVCREFEAGMEKLLKIKTIASGIWGRQAKTPKRPVTDKTWDYALSLEFESVKNHNLYQEDPAHHEFVEAFKDRWEKVLVMDVG